MANRWRPLHFTHHNSCYIQHIRCHVHTYYIIYIHILWLVIMHFIARVYNKVLSVVINTYKSIHTHKRPLGKNMLLSRIQKLKNVANMWKVAVIWVIYYRSYDNQSKVGMQYGYRLKYIWCQWFKMFPYFFLLPHTTLYFIDSLILQKQRQNMSFKIGNIMTKKGRWYILL